MKCKQAGLLSEKVSPLTVWTAGQDRDWSRFKEKLRSGHGWTRQPDTTFGVVINPDPVSWNGSFQDQKKFSTSLLNGGITGALLQLSLGFSDRPGVITVDGEDGVDVRVSRWMWRERGG